MKQRRWVLMWAALSLGACNQVDDQQPAANTQEPPVDQPSARAPALPSEPGTPGGLPDDRTRLAEPRGPIDPKSAEAAGQVVQHYGALLEQQRFKEAEARWSDAAGARAFTSALRSHSEVHVEIGRPGDMGGAAGSVYVSVPVVFYGKLQSGDAFRRPADVILRRVNDVPGSTERQRRWHIDRIAWSGAG